VRGTKGLFLVVNASLAAQTRSNVQQIAFYLRAKIAHNVRYSVQLIANDGRNILHQSLNDGLPG
jgi:hypothetical protein